MTNERGVEEVGVGGGHRYASPCVIYGDPGLGFGWIASVQVKSWPSHNVKPGGFVDKGDSNSIDVRGEGARMVGAVTRDIVVCLCG